MEKKTKWNSHLSFRINAVSWNDFSEELLAKLTEDFEKVSLKVPNNYKKMAGDPGCTPRFGFDLRQEVRDGKPIMVIDGVISGSSASKIVMKKGDIFIAIDSSSYEEFNNRKDATEIYENGTSVPVKFQRVDKVSREMIKSTVICDHKDESWLK